MTVWTATFTETDDGIHCTITDETGTQLGASTLHGNTAYFNTYPELVAYYRERLFAIAARNITQTRHQTRHIWDDYVE